MAKDFVVIAIPARFASSRFPGKPIHPIAGKPLVAWVVEAVKKAKRLDDVIVATDDARIVAAVEACGGKAVMTPSELPSGTDRIACAARIAQGGDFAGDLVPLGYGVGGEGMLAGVHVDVAAADADHPDLHKKLPFFYLGGGDLPENDLAGCCHNLLNP